MQTKFSTKRLLLDLVAEDDDAFILALVNSKGWLEFIGDRNVHSKQEAIEYIRKIKNTPDLFYWVARLKISNTPVGIVSFLKRSYLDHFDIGFAFLPEFNGQGYAYEATKKILSVVSKKPGYSPILATTIPGNTSSIKLLTKLGLHFEREMEIQDQKLNIYST